MLSLLNAPIFLIAAATFLNGGHCHKTRPFLKYYESLSYDRDALLHHHQRSKRAATEEESLIPLDLFAYKRKFELMLRRDGSVFASDFEVISDNRSVPTDISFLYTGKLKDYSLMKNDNTFEMNLKKYKFLEKMKWKSKEETIKRHKRSVDLSRTTCLLHLKADYLFFKRFRNLQEAISQIAGYMIAVNSIYDQINFNGIRHINFKVKVLNVFQEEQPNSIMHSDFIGLEKLLMLHSTSNWNSVCLSYLFTNRDYNGIYGLAWIGAEGNVGGICSKFSKLNKSLDIQESRNTGIITIQSYGSYLPPRLIHIILAHELGHSLGSPHDESKDCAKFSVIDPNGNYLMFPKAMDGNQYNNDKLSPCSIHYIGSLLKVKKDQCFIESDKPICGNQIVEDVEQCDVGYKDNDPCCYGANEGEGLQCTLKPGKQCSPSQGMCCNELCSHKPKGEQCREEAECTVESFCTGESARCPKPAPKTNYTLCNYGTRICLNGMCLQSICVKYGLEQCDCNSLSIYEMCQLCCQKPGDVYSCKSTASTELEHLFKRSVIVLPPGTACGQRQGYCDKFHVCRLVDADGPIARLKNSFLNLIESDPAAWMKTRWWAILLIILTLAAMMVGTIYILGRTLDSNKVKELGKETKRPNACNSEAVCWEKDEDDVFID
ncbi:disintegrin and metalloproteinase domain-containing protein 10-like isoform X2 [Mixophyes fleayi]|uniref:disintegrin and metalloproteinase domain-containing protein 10-like isoform X2 n=1 Tax=Mixophyes fleayi TaxID=3061075 RepID=UPI003F4E1ECA